MAEPNGAAPARGPYDPVPHGKGVRTPPHPGESQSPRENLLSRRDFIRNTVRLAVAGAVIPGALSQLLPAVAPAALAGGGPGPIIRRAGGQKIPITIDDLAGPAPVVVTAEWNFLPAVVYKVKVEALRGSSEVQKYNTAQHAVAHPTEDAHAILAYIGKCKHLGCTVGWNATLGGAMPSAGKEDYDGDGINDGRILCPCHQGQYDIYNLALNQPGTPPPSPLDVIRINIDSYSDPDGRVQSASNALVGVGSVEQGKALAADLDSNKAFNLRAAATKIEA